MRRIKFTKVVTPEIVAYIANGEDMMPEYRCPECGMGIAEDYVCCPYCRSDLTWDKVKQPKNEEFRKLIDSL